MFKTIQILFIGLISALLLTACGKKEEPVSMAQPATPPAEAVPAATADGIPAISNGVEYPAFRKILIGSGWIPDKQTQECGFNCQGKRRDGLIETETCADTGFAPCIFIFKNKESAVLKVYTVGENLSVEKTEGGAVSSAPASAAVSEPQPEEKPIKKAQSQSKYNDPIGVLKDRLNRDGWSQCAAVFLDAQASYIRSSNVSQRNEAELNRMLDIMAKVKTRLINEVPPEARPQFREVLDAGLTADMRILGSSRMAERKKIFDDCVKRIYEVAPPN